MNARRLAIMAILLLCASSPASAKIYDCKVDPPLALNRINGGAELKPIQFPQLTNESWAFKVRIKPGKKDEADTAIVDWPSNPIQIVGEFPVLPTAKGAIAFAAYGFQGCMFTEAACLAAVQIVEQGGGKAKIVILPTALATDSAADKRDPFVTLIEGTCSWKDS